MIAYLTGKIRFKEAQKITLDVGGVGYSVCVSLPTFYELPPEGLEVSLHIHTYLREDQLTLFGFLNLDEKILFQQLIKVSGIGPKLAMTLLSGLSPYEIRQAIATENKNALKAIPGIGQKMAERILIELKGKIQIGARPQKQTTASQAYDEALSALTYLGYTKVLAERALAKLDWSKGIELKDAIKQSLKNLARG